MSVVVVGGGWAGCAAAYSARLAGSETILVEKTDKLLGTGLVGGIMCNNGRFTALEELCALGAGDIIHLIEEVATHRNLDFPGHRHAMLYDVTRIEASVRGALVSLGVQLKMQKRMTAAARESEQLVGIETANGEIIRGDVYVDATGTAGPVNNCAKFGRGCAMCILRCPTFGPRVSLTAMAGVTEIRAGAGFQHFEAMSGSCKLKKKSLSPDLVKELEKNGVLVIPLPKHLQKSDQLARKVCQQYAIPDFAENLIILDTGHAKLMTSYFPLEILRTLEGFQEAIYADPYSGGRGNSVRFMAMSPCDDSLKVTGVSNLFCAGEKTGLLVGHTEAIATGFLAGHNAVRLLAGKELLVLPRELACGDIISFMHEDMRSPAGMGRKYTFSGSVYFERMLELGLYTIDVAEIQKRVAKAGLAGIFKHRQIKDS